MKFKAFDKITDRILARMVDVFTIDGLAHFFYGFFIYNLLTLFCSPFWSGIILLTIAILKELYDYFSAYHSADFWDIVMTIAPAVFQILLSFLKSKT